MAAVMALSLTACGGNATDNNGQSAPSGQSLIIASSASSNLTTFALQQEMADKANEASGGKLNIELSWDGVL